jgi:glycerate 2-kinase
LDRRQLLLSVFQQALAAVNGRRCVRAALADVAAEELEWRVIAIGKAASAMTLGAFDALGARIARALVVTKVGHVDAELAALGNVRCLESAHPIPDARSLAAGDALLEELRAALSPARLLFLISGGTSSLVESLRPGLGLDALVKFNEWALANDLDIRRVNALRRRMSMLKGGRLLSHLDEREALALFISDVPGNDPAVIGSGLLGAPVEQPLPAGLPSWVRELAVSDPVPIASADAHVTRRVIATLEDAMLAAREFAAARGLSTRLSPKRFTGEATELAVRFCHELRLSNAELNIWGGESTVRLPPNPGQGGRNQHLALAAARLLVAHDDLALLAAGTDGTDGTTDDAGALVDSGTVERGTVDGFDADDHLARADSATFLEASGDLVHTGPTGTNVGDLVLGLAARA